MDRSGQSFGISNIVRTVERTIRVYINGSDHASDEEGYLLEAKPKGSTDFAVVAVLDPNVNTFGLITLPSEKTAEYRLRAYYYGASSNTPTRRPAPDRRTDPRRGARYP